MSAPRVILAFGLAAMILAAATAVATAQTQVEVVGLHDRTPNEVLNLMGGRLIHVRSSPASPPLADDAAFLLRQLLRNDGYTEATVDWQIAGSRRIVLRVNEGARQSLGQVTVHGVPAADAKKLAKLYQRAAEKERPLGAGPPPFREPDIETGLSYLRQELNAHGYWAAEVTLTDHAKDRGTGAIDITIDVKPGPLHTIGQPTMTGDDAGVALTSAAVRPFFGREATTAHINAMRVAVEESTTGSGYPDALTLMTQSIQGGKFIPGFSVKLGNRVRLARLHIQGMERTNPDRIAQRLQSMQGEWYDEAAMNRRLREFLATGAFSSARVETQPVSDGWIDATLSFDEARAREVSLALGFGSYQGVVTRASYSDRNLFGNLMAFNAGIELGSRGLLGEVSVTDPWWYGSDVSVSARAYAMTYDREGYLTLESGLEAKATRKFTTHYSLELLAGYSLVNLDDDGLPPAELGDTSYGHPRLRATQKWDYRDNPVLPQNGWHLECPLEIGAAIGDTSTPYLMAGISGGWFHQINPTYQLGIGGEARVLIPGGDGSDLPIDVRLFNGGARSVRSFPERELGPSVAGYPTGGEAAWSANVELARSISSMVKAVVFFDAGSVARDYPDFASSEIELAAGLGIRLNLPVGPVRFEYGFNLTRDDGEPSGTFHFAIGHAY